MSTTTVDEAAGTADFVVSIPEAATDLISFNVSTVDISATANEDYVPLTAQSYEIPVGQSQVTVTVSIINDTIEEVAENFRFAVRRRRECRSTIFSCNWYDHR